MATARRVSLVFLFLLVTVAGRDVPLSSEQRNDALAVPAAAGSVRPALAEMVAAERAFARLGAEKGARDSFLEYFADSAVTLEYAEARPAKKEILSWPPRQSGSSLSWDPRVGDVAASGELGYLTGPVVSIAPGGTPRHMCYMSVWKRQADGAWKVVLDFGVQVKSAPSFPASFTPSFTMPRYAIHPVDVGESKAGLEKAERLLAEARRTQPAADAYAPFFINESLVYRVMLQPVAGREQALRWAASEPRLASSDNKYVEVAASGDFGYTWGDYSVAGKAAGSLEKGHYARVWCRDARGDWHVLMDVARPVR